MSEVTDQPEKDGSERAIRADAQRNEDLLLAVAREVFATKGVDTPVREIAAKAGVGVGTLYRRFPRRSDLVTAVFRHEVDACAAAARTLAAEYPPTEALARWLRRYTEFLAAKKGLAAALHSGDPAYAALPDYFRANFEPALAQLLQASAATGATRTDIAAYDLLRAIGNLSVSSGPDAADHTARMVELLIDGLRQR